MRMYDIIKKKRDGGELSREEIQFFIDGYVDGSIPDYQASALCMAIFYKGMTPEETATLTLAMAESGDMVDLSAFGDRTVDKHSTGGVGDKTTLVVAPIVSAAGCVIAKMSGRGLGHTGGTVDKLESIEGFNTALSPEEFFAQAEEIGIAVVGQTGNLTPADKKLYALRDVTATVDSLPLIASSIMSKKIAAGSHTIVLDVKYGSGAFMKTPEDAEALAREMVRIGNNCGRKTSAVISNMDRPLGYNIGNALEVMEAVEILNNRGAEDLREVCLTLASQIISLSKGIAFDEARALAEDSLTSGKALHKFKEWIGTQGGNTSWIDKPALFPKATVSYDVKSPKSGYIEKTNAETIGIASVILGAGRETKDDTIDMTAGIILHKKNGDLVNEGDTLATLYSCDESSFPSSEKKFLSGYVFSDTKPQDEALIYKII